ncbi:MAG: hypothetical protein WEA34_02365 [Gemmatimonadota bacterium]
MHRLRPLLVVTALAAACAPGSDRPDAPTAATLRDSAGVTIVENRAAALDADAPWTVGAEPMLDLGTVEGEGPEAFFRVRDVHRAADGRIFVADAGNAEVRVFSADGSHLATWGGEGDGPGEFRAPDALLPWPAGDTMGVWDSRQRRVTLFDSDGDAVRSFPISDVASVSSPRVFGILPDGALLLTGIEFAFEDASAGLVRPPTSAALVEPDLSERAHLGTHPGSESLMSVSPERVEIFRVPFARGAVAEVVGDGVVFSPTDRWELRIHGRDGRLERIARVDRAPTPLTPEIVEAEVERRVAGAPDAAQAGLRARLTEGPHPDALPAFGDVVGDADGRLWVEVFRPESEVGPARWAVFDAEGRLLGAVTLPEGFTPHRAGDGWLLGVAEDDLGVERVQLWPVGP